MNEELLFTFIVIGVIFILGIVLGILIMKTDLLYDKENARWKSGINLPGLDAKKEDKVNHKGFKKFIGINTVALFTLIAGAVVIGLLLLPEQASASEEALWAKLFITILYVLILIPMFLMFSNYKEKYIERITSKKPKHHKILLIIITALLVIIAGLTWFLL